MMSHTTSAMVMNQYVTALLERQDCAKFLAPDVVWTTMETGHHVRGREAVRDFIVAMHTQIFDARLEVVSLLCGDGAATMEAVFDGKHTADFAGQPATGIHIRLPYCMAYDVSEGLISAIRAYFPMTTLISELAS